MGKTGKIKIQMSADDQQLFREMKRLEQQYGSIGNAMKKLGRESDKAGKKGAKGAKDAGTATKRATEDIKQMALRWGSVGAAVVAAHKVMQLVTKELELQRQLQKEAAEKQVTLAGARKELLRNLGGTREQRQAVLKQLGGMAVETGVPERVLTQAAAAAVSAGGGDIGRAMGAVRAAAKLLPDQPAAIATYAGTLLDLAKVTDQMTGGQFDPQVAKGLLIQVGKMSRIVQPQFQARNIAPALIGMQTFGADVKESSALFAAISNAAADFQGAITGTATISFAEQLRGLFKEGQGFVELGTGQFKKVFQEVEGWQKMTMGQRVGALQTRPELAKAFVQERLSLEKKAKGPFEELLLRPTSVAAKEYQKNLKALGGAEELRAAARRVQESFVEDPLERVAKLRRQYQATTGRLETTDVYGALLAVHREGLKPLLEKAGRGVVGRKLAGMRFEAMTLVEQKGAAGEVAKIIRDEIRALRAPETILPPAGVGAPATMVPREPTGRELQIADVLAQHLQQMEKIQRETAKAIADAIREQRGGGRTGVPPGVDR